MQADESYHVVVDDESRIEPRMTAKPVMNIAIHEGPTIHIRCRKDASPKPFSRQCRIMIVIPASQ